MDTHKPQTTSTLNERAYRLGTHCWGSEETHTVFSCSFLAQATGQRDRRPFGWWRCLRIDMWIVGVIEYRCICIFDDCISMYCISMYCISIVLCRDRRMSSLDVRCWLSFYGHTVDALASGADEGRGSLRYSSGSRQPGCDPGVSEWGNPALVMECRRHLNV